ncbi:gliding motility protein RemB [Flavobacterium sp. NST-5]|uniref:Gliding motility protein RemB n=1 Tax=Flavobacterium ichthyis TaxID=2698827 RepID=A0ABW9ZBP9_9FLAO|nr:gliding motility protein RemB [Flavobacterium ichthyis]NBL65546.1 gliding motility protein RemB [Flavobacterium ichthyis]
MKKIFALLLIFLIQVSLKAQTSKEQFPVFPECQSLEASQVENCFYQTLEHFVFNNFKVPQEVTADNFQGNVVVLFEVTDEGNFSVQYVSAAKESLSEESKRVFNLLPKIIPPTYNGKPTYAKYTLNIGIPLVAPTDRNLAKATPKINDINRDRSKELTEFDSIVYQKFDNPQLKSRLNIPFSHSFYARFDRAMNQVGANNHTSSKPYTFEEVNRYYDLEQDQKSLQKNKQSWAGKKLWNENLVAIQGEGYWFTLNPIFDLQLGKSDPSETNYTFQNTRGIQVNGEIGKQLSFTTTIFESQGRFADYYNRFIESLAPSGGNPATIPGIGIAKEFKEDAYDFPMAEANITFTPNQFINLQLGYGRNFLGDGYRSLLQGDGVSPHPYFKLNTTFWKIKYTNLYMWLKDIRPEATVDGTYGTKFIASHYLSWNVTKRWNLGFFESVVWTNQNDRGFDMTFVNPIIFYRAVEFGASSKTGNALLGLTSKYKFNNQIMGYGQFLLDEFSLADMKSGEKSWKNKYGFQLGAKYFDAFNVKNLLLQLEYNNVRPYVYSHSNPLTNYGHSNQSMGHQWGGNFREFIAIARYYKGRWFGDAKFTYGKRGLDFNTPENNFNYGGDIYQNYDVNRPFDVGVEVGQGNTSKIFIADLQAGYVINPTTNLKLFGSLIYRNFNPLADTTLHFKENTTWFSVGIRSDIFNWYFDY